MASGTVIRPLLTTGDVVADKRTGRVLGRVAGFDGHGGVNVVCPDGLGRWVDYTSVVRVE